MGEKDERLMIHSGADGSEIHDGPVGHDPKPVYRSLTAETERLRQELSSAQERIALLDKAVEDQMAVTNLVSAELAAKDERIAELETIIYHGRMAGIYDYSEIEKHIANQLAKDARIAALESALKPFADEYDTVPTAYYRREDIDVRIVNAPTANNIMLSDLRRAASVLEGKDDG